MGEMARLNLIGYDGEDSSGADRTQGAPWKNVDVANGTTHTNSLVETAIASSVFQPGELRIGSVIHFEALVKVLSAQSTDTLTLKVYCGTTALTTAIFTNAAEDVTTNDIWHVRGTIVIRDTDDAGGYQAVVSGSTIPDAEGTYTHKVEETVQSSLNLQDSALRLEIGADWSVAHADNQVATAMWNVSVT